MVLERATGCEATSFSPETVARKSAKRIIGPCTNVLFTMTQPNAQLKAAQVRWELKLTVLQEEERRLFSMLEEQSRESAALPQDMLDRLKAARSQCNEAFKLLMGAIEDRVSHGASAQEVSRQDDAP